MKVTAPWGQVYEIAEYSAQELAKLPAGVARLFIEKAEEQSIVKECFPKWAEQLRLRPSATRFSKNLTEGGDAVPEGGSCWDVEVDCDGCDNTGEIESHGIRKDCPICDGFSEHHLMMIFVDSDYNIVGRSTENQ